MKVKYLQLTKMRDTFGEGGKKGVIMKNKDKTILNKSYIQFLSFC